MVNGVINYDHSRVEQRMMNFGLLTTTVSWLIFTHHKLTLGIWRIKHEFRPRDIATREISKV